MPLFYYNVYFIMLHSTLYWNWLFPTASGLMLWITKLAIPDTEIYPKLESFCHPSIPVLLSSKYVRIIHKKITQFLFE